MSQASRMYESSSESEPEEFSGEFNHQLPKNFKIPKATPKKPNESEENTKDKNQTGDNAKDEYTSPLEIVEQSLSGLIESNKSIENNESVNRKRKFPPPTTILQHSPPKDTKPPASMRLPGRSTEFPDELNEFFQPLTCNLCKAPFTSIKVAWSHYDSKSHLKKVTAWLTEWTSKTGETMPKIPKLLKEGEAGPDAYHCKACDLRLTSLLHANQHYNGKKHKMVVENLAKPSGSGYYDPKGNWVRQQTKIITDSRYGIGESFRKSGEDNKTNNKKPETEEPNKPDTKNLIKPEGEKSNKTNDHNSTKSESENSSKANNQNPFKSESERPNKSGSEKQKKPSCTVHCDICNIDVSSEAQMQDHLKGSKHAKKLKSLEKPPHAPPTDTVLASMNSRIKDDMSMYRTPTGSYYCKVCNFSLLDPVHMKQHLSGKRHAKNLKNKPPANEKSTNNVSK